MYQNNYEAIYLIISRIPIGKVTTYGLIANQLPGVSPRLVARALKTLPEGTTLPWHRVVSANLKIANFLNSDNQIEKLIQEGVTFRATRSISREHLWNQAL